MRDMWLSWSAPEAWPRAAVANVSCDAQLYQRCPACRAEMRLMPEFAEDASPQCSSCGASGATFVRHLEQVECVCHSCHATTELMIAGNEEPRCSRCKQKDVSIRSKGIVPPFPPRFHEALASHQWGVSGQNDGRAVLTEAQSAAMMPDAERYIVVATRFCRRLRLWGGYPSLRDRALIRNVEANILRDYFRAAGDLPAALLALQLFEDASRECEDLREKALEQHNCAMTVYSMLARNAERDVIVATGRNRIRREAIQYAEQAANFFAAANDADSRVQLARILHITGDLYRAGDSNLDELRLSLEKLNAAAAIRGIPAQLLENINYSRSSTQQRADTLHAEQSQSQQQDEEFDNPEGLDYSIIRLEGDPEEVAENLIRDSLPKTQLDEIDIGDQAGMGRLLACLLLRRSQASLEKDEILRFVDRNRRPLQTGSLDVIRKLAAAGAGVEGGKPLGNFLEYFSTAVEAALQGRPQDIDLKSDRLLWLLYALAHQLAGGGLDYNRASAILYKPQHRNRISRLSLMYMLKDFADTIDTPNQPPVEYLLLILECALASDDAPAAAAASAVLGRLPAPRDPAAVVDVLERARALLASADRPTADVDECLARYRCRFRSKVADDDL